jgi:hypothetical protein
MGDAFREGGWTMLPTTMFGLLLLAAAVRYALSPERRFVPLQMSLGVMTIACGALGFVMGVMKSFSAMGGVEPDKRWIWLLGVGESLNNVAVAFALVTAAAVAASIGAYRIARSLPDGSGRAAA